jgi:hypothetical protein
MIRDTLRDLAALAVIVLSVATIVAAYAIALDVIVR